MSEGPDDYTIEGEDHSLSDFTDEPLPPRFILYYEHKSVGFDQYYSSDGQMTREIGEAMQWSAREDASAVAMDYPSIDDNHKDVEILAIRPPTKTEFLEMLARNKRNRGE